MPRKKARDDSFKSFDILISNLFRISIFGFRVWDVQESTKPFFAGRKQSSVIAVGVAARPGRPVAGLARPGGRPRKRVRSRRATDRFCADRRPVIAPGTDDCHRRERRPTGSDRPHIDRAGSPSV